MINPFKNLARLWIIKIGAILILCGPIIFLADAEVDNTIYRIQMGKYRKLSERYHQQRLEIARLQKKSEQMKKRHAYLESKADAIQEKINKYELKQKKASQNVSLYQAEFKRYENIATQKEKQYWKTQKDYGRHQKEYVQICNKKNATFKKIKNNMAAEIKLGEKISHYQKKHNDVNLHIKQLQKEMVSLKKSYDRMIQPLEGI